MTPPTRFPWWAILALVAAAGGTAGSLYLSLGMGLKACPLCFYQRSFVMSVLAVLIVGLLADRSRGDLLCLLCLPLAIAGLSVAGFHVYLELTGKLECPKALLGIGTAPQQSLALFALLTAAVTLGALRSAAAIIAGFALGALLAWGCVASSPPMPKPPVKPYDQPLEVCRPPFVP